MHITVLQILKITRFSQDIIFSELHTDKVFITTAHDDLRHTQTCQMIM